MQSEADGRGNSVSVEGEDELLKQLNKMVSMTKAERVSIIEAGAPIVESHLKNEIPKRVHLYPSQDKLYGHPIGHLTDSVTHKPGQYMDGGTDIGFNSTMAPIARWVNWGTYRQNPQFFMEHSFNSLDKDAVFDAQRKQTIKVLKEKGVDID